MKAIENAAYVSVGRACGFAGLGIFCLMFGLSFEPALAARTGGVSCAIVTAILILYGNRARQRPYKRTELWIILNKEERPPASVAQQIIGQVLRQTYIWFARQAAVISFVLLASGFVLQFAV